MSKEWEDKYLVLKKENERLKELQRDQAQREHKIAARLVSLKEQQLALQEGRAIAGDGPREAKLAELQASLYSLEGQHQQLTSKLHAMKNPSSSKTSSPAVRKAQPAAQQPKAGKASDPHGEGANRAQLVVAQLKREILETNLALSKIKEQQTSGELQDSLAQFKVGHSGAAQDVKEREELKRELKTKEAKYTLAKSKLDSLDKEYKDYVQKHKQLINQAEETQRAIFEQQKQHRTLEAQIKQLKLEKDQESDMKSILEDMREELNLLKDDNRRLKEDNMSGQSLISRSEKHGAEVEKLSSDRTELSTALAQQQERDIALRKKLEEKRSLQRRLEKERAEKQSQLDALRQTHQEMTRSLDNFSLNPSGAHAEASSTDVAVIKPADTGEGVDSDFAVLLGKLKEHLGDRGYSAIDCFKSWNKAGNGLLIEQEAIDGLLQTNLGLQADDARRLFRHMVQEPQQNPAEPTISQADFDKLITEAKRPSEAGPSDSSALQAELRKLRGVNAELLREKEEWIRKLKNRELSTRAGGDAGHDMSGEARVRALGVEFGAELTRLEGLISIAELNNRDLSAMKAAPAKRQIAAAAGSGSPEKIQRSMRSSNTVVVEIHSISLEPGSFAQEPTTFLSLDFYAHDTQNTYPATGLDVELGWSCEFVVEVDEVLVSYMEREPLRLELMERVSQSVPFRRIAAAALDLKPLLDDAVMGRRRCELTKDGSGGGRVGKVDISIRLGQPLGPAVQALREPRASSKATTKSAAMRQPIPPFLSMEKPPYKLKLTVVRAEKLRSSRYGHLPSPYVQYSFPGSKGDPHLTATVPRTVNPLFDDERTWELKEGSDVMELRSQELEVMVLDDDDDGDDEAGLLGTGKLSIGSFVDKQQGGEVNVPLRGLDGGLSGSLIVHVAWELASAPPPPAASTPGKARVAAPAAATTTTSAAGRAAPAPKASAPKLDKKVAVREEEGWLQSLAQRFSEFGWPARKVFNNFDIDGDDEISWNDFKEAIANEPLKLTGDQQKKLFEYWAGDSNKNITFPAFERALNKDSDATSRGFGKDCIGLFVRELTVTSPKLLAGDTLPSRVCVLLDFLKQPAEQELASSRAVSLVKRGSTTAKAAFLQAVSISLENRAARARVLAALGKERGAGLQDITVMVCPVKDDGHVDMEHIIGRAALDVQQLLTDKRDLKGFSLQLLGPDEKPTATLTLDSNIAGVLQPMLVEGAGAVPGKGLRAAGAQEAAVGELAKVFAGKGMSLRAVFQNMDQDCDGLIGESDFVEAIANEKLSTDKADRGQMFAYIADGKEAVDQRTFESVLGRASGSGIVLTQADVDAKESIVVIVRSLKLKPDVQTRLEKRYKTLSIEADFFRQPADQPLVSSEQRSFAADTPVVNFNDKLELPMKKDQADEKSKGNRRRVSEAIESGSKNANIELSVVGRAKDDSGKGDVLATGTVEVGMMWKDQEELRDYTMQLIDDDGRPSGSLTLDCLAMQALRTLSLTRDASSIRQAPTPQAPPPRPSSSSSAARPTPTTAKPADGDGKVWVRIEEVKAEELPEDLSKAGWSVTGNFLRQQTSREEARQRSSNFSLSSFRPAKPDHTLSFGVSKGALKANLEALKASLEKDEAEGSSRVVITLAREAVGAEYAADGVINVASAHCSIADALHARDGATASLELPLTYVDGARKGEKMGALQVKMGFQSVGLGVVEGREAVGGSEAKEEDEAMVVWGELLDIGSKGAAQDRGVRQATSVSLTLSGAGKTRSMFTKDDGGNQLPRPKLAVNHKWVYAGDALKAVYDAGKIRVSIADVSGRREEELGDAEVDVKGLLSKGKRDHSVSVTLSSTKSKVATLQLHITLPASASAEKKAAGGKDSKAASKDVISLTIESFALDEASPILKDAKFRRLMGSVQWFGETVDAHQTRELEKSTFVSVDRAFSLDLKDKAVDAKKPFRDLLQECINLGDKGEGIEVILWGISGSGKDEENHDVAVAKLTDRDLMGGGESSIRVVMKSADKAGEDPKCSVKVKVSALQALSTLRFRGPGRSAAAPAPDKSFVVALHEGSRLARERDRDSNIVAAVKSLRLAGPLLAGGKSFGHITKVFIAANFFGSAQQMTAVAVSGSDAHVLAETLDPDCRFTCPVDIAHPVNRDALKTAGADSFSLDMHLFKEPWSDSDSPLATGSIAMKDLVEGQETKVELKDEGTLLASALVQVFFQEAFKTAGLQSS